MARGLSVSGVVRVDVYISPLAAPMRNFGVALIMGDSEVIDPAQRTRGYQNLDQLADEFGTTAPEYLAARLYFSQQPQPNLVYVGRWARLATHATLHGGELTPDDLQMTTWAAIANGSMSIAVDGTIHNLTGLNFTAQTNLNGVAAVITAALAGAATVVWDSVYERFEVTSASTGPASTLGYAVPVAPATGIDISTMTGLTVAVSSAPDNGRAAETPVAATQAAADANGDWYGVAFAAATMPSDNALVDVASYIEGSDRQRMIGVTVQNPQAMDPLISTDLGSRLQALGFKRSYVHFSRQNAYAALSAFGRAFTVNFNAMNSTMTLKFKQMPGVVAEYLTASQAMALEHKNYNVFVHYDNDTSIIEQGVMANGYFFDEVHGLDWLANATQTNVWNVLYQATTKIPQTDPGITRLVAACNSTMEAGVNNGLIAPGVWNGPPIGVLDTGQALTRGYYTYAPRVATQVQSDREKRKAPPIQITVKLAGAVHFADVIIQVNR